MTVERVVGIGAGAAEVAAAEAPGGLATQDMVLNIGPQHPSTHGVLRLRLVLDGEMIISAEPIVGYMHRGAEKLFEVRDYRQILVLANRHDWLSAFANEIGVALAVERMVGLEVPIRATWARTLLTELNRMLNHLMFLGSYPLEIGAITPIFYAFRERETIQGSWRRSPAAACTSCSTGSAASATTFRPDGPDAPAPAVAEVRGRLRQIHDLILGNEIFRARTVGVGVLTPEVVRQYGVSGPVARASGVDFDLRRDEPYLAYGELFAPGGPGRVVTKDSRRLLRPIQLPLRAGRGLARSRRRLPGPPRLPAGRPGERPPAEGAQGAGGSGVRLDGEPARAQRLLPREQGRQDALPAQAPLGVVQQRPDAG